MIDVDKHSRIISASLIIALAAAIILPAAFWFLVDPPGSFPTQRFDTQKWKAADTDADTRCRMAADLTDRIGLVGKTRDELDRLLGEPDDQDGDRTYSHWHLCPSLADIYILEVKWQDDRAVSARVRDT